MMGNITLRFLRRNTAPPNAVSDTPQTKGNSGGGCKFLGTIDFYNLNKTIQLIVVNRHTAVHIHLSKFQRWIKINGAHSLCVLKVNGCFRVFAIAKIDLLTRRVEHAQCALFYGAIKHPRKSPFKTRKGKHHF